MTFEDRINSYYHELNGTDKHIIKQILIHTPQWEEMNQQKLADLCNASTASIHRMLKRLNFGGFSEFKYYMINTPSVDEERPSTQNYRDFLVNAIDTTLEINSPENLKQIIELIHHAPTVYGFGTGTEQRDSLKNFSDHLMYYEKPIYMLDSITDINLMSLKMKRDDLFIVVSLSGNTMALDEMVEILKLKGIVILSITNNTKNAIAASADFNLYFQDDSFNGLKSLHWPAITLRVLLDHLLHTYLDYKKEQHHG